MISPSVQESSSSPLSRDRDIRENSTISNEQDQGTTKQRHNVKFTVDATDERRSSQTKSLPEIRLPEDSDDIAEYALPLDDTIDWMKRKDAAAISAYDKANRHADKVKKHNSVPSSRRTSLENDSTLVGSPYNSPPQHPVNRVRIDDIPLEDLEKPRKTRVFDLPEDDRDSDSDNGNDVSNASLKPIQRQDTYQVHEAERLRQIFTKATGRHLSVPSMKNRSGSATPLVDQHSHEYDYVPRPEEFKPSVLRQLLNLRASSQDIQSPVQRQQDDYVFSKLAPYSNPETDPRKKHPDFFRTRNHTSRSPRSLSGAQSPLGGASTGSSGYITPRQKRPKWYKTPEGQWQYTPDPNTYHSMGSLSKLIGTSFQAATAPATPQTSTQRPVLSRNASSGRRVAEALKHPINHMRYVSNSNSQRKQEEAARDERMSLLIDRLVCQDYIVEICKALMSFGAPTHRLEESLSMAARKLRIHASFQYLPSCMIISFDDPDTHTTELKLVKEPTAVDLGKLLEVQHVYKDVMHNQYSLMDAMDDIAEIRRRPKRFNTVTLVLMYGLAAVSVGPFAFSARPMDFPVSFLLGCVLGGLQLGVAPRSSQFSHVFEVFGTCITSFAARGFGSILTSTGQPLFCFSALAQTSIALILPGWIILSASLELQSRNIIAGSIRMVYAIIYTLFLGFGILIGTTIMGLAYPDATNDITCHMPEYWDVTSNTDWKIVYTRFIWVPMFTICLAVINQAKFKQIPWMVFISFCGYQVNYWSGIRFSQNIQVANALGAFVIGVLANGYSRFRHGVAAAAMLPAIFVMVPSGLAASGSLIAGLTSANQITHNVTGISIVNNGTQGFYDAQNVTASSAASSVYGGTIFNVGYGMVQVAIGISVGLFLSALVIYPFGKKRSGLFSF